MKKIQDDFSLKEKNTYFTRKNKFIYFVIFLIFFILGIIIYNGYSKHGVDRNSYVLLVEGEGYLNDKNLSLNDRELLNIGDTIKTTTENALAIIEWGDGSITRLGGNTSIVINEIFVSDLKDKINISFNLLSGKTWSNVISYIPGDSYFKQTFMDYEAAVRGTVFNVDLENDYLYVVSHSVFLNSLNGEKIEIKEQEPFNIRTFEFIRLEEFIRNFKDSIFEDLNRKLDNDYLRFLREEVILKLENLTNLINMDTGSISSINQEELYLTYLNSYQDLHFVSASDLDLFEYKIFLKEKLISLSNDGEKERLLNSLANDFYDSVKTNSYNSMDKILGVFSKHKEFIGSSNDIIEHLNKINFDGINQDLRDSIFNNIETLNGVLNLDSLINTFNDYKTGIRNVINNSLNNLFNN